MELNLFKSYIIIITMFWPLMNAYTNSRTVYASVTIVFSSPESCQNIIILRLLRFMRPQLGSHSIFPFRNQSSSYLYLSIEFLQSDTPSFSIFYNYIFSFSQVFPKVPKVFFLSDRRNIRFWLLPTTALA